MAVSEHLNWNVPNFGPFGLPEFGSTGSSRPDRTEHQPSADHHHRGQARPGFGPFELPEFGSATLEHVPAKSPRPRKYATIGVRPVRVRSFRTSEVRKWRGRSQLSGPSSRPSPASHPRVDQAPSFRKSGLSNFGTSAVLSPLQRHLAASLRTSGVWWYSARSSSNFPFFQYAELRKFELTVVARAGVGSRGEHGHSRLS